MYKKRMISLIVFLLTFFSNSLSQGSKNIENQILNSIKSGSLIYEYTDVAMSVIFNENKISTDKNYLETKLSKLISEKINYKAIYFYYDMDVFALVLIIDKTNFDSTTFKENISSLGFNIFNILQLKK